MGDVAPPITPDISPNNEQKPGQTLRTFSNMLNPYYGKKKVVAGPKWIHARKMRKIK